MSNSEDCQSCELLETCSFYWNYRTHIEVQNRHLINIYCNSSDLSESCARIIYYRVNREYPPANLSPEGDLITMPSLRSVSQIAG